MTPASNLAKFVPFSCRKLLDDYSFFLDSGRKAFENQKISPAIRKEKLRLLEKALRKEFPLAGSVVTRLQKAFIAENLSVSLLLEPLNGWKYLAENKFPTSETQLSDIISTEISPLARLIMVLNNENPSTYFPFASLLLLYEMQKLISDDDILLKKARFSKRQRESVLKGLYKNAAVILALVHGKKLKFQLALALNIAKFRTKSYTKRKRFSLTLLDRRLAVLYSIWQFLFIRRRSTAKKGI